MSSRASVRRHRTHQRVVAPALLEILQLQVDVARVLPGEDRVLRIVELPSGPWHAAQTCALASTAGVLRAAAFEQGQRRCADATRRETGSEVMESFSARGACVQ